MAKYRDIFDIQQGGEHGRTALHLAAIQDHEECARILVRLKVIPKVVDIINFRNEFNFLILDDSH